MKKQKEDLKDLDHQERCNPIVGVREMHLMDMKRRKKAIKYGRNAFKEYKNR